MNDKAKARPTVMFIALGAGEIIAVAIIYLLSYAVEVVPVPDGAAPITRIFAAVTAINNREISFAPHNVWNTFIHDDGTMVKVSYMFCGPCELYLSLVLRLLRQ